MIILGLDIGRASAVGFVLEFFPSNPKQFFSRNRQNILRLESNEKSIHKLLDLAADAIVLESQTISNTSTQIIDRTDIDFLQFLPTPIPIDIALQARINDFATSVQGRTIPPPRTMGTLISRV